MADEKLAIDRLMEGTRFFTNDQYADRFDLIQRVAEECARIAEDLSDEWKNAGNVQRIHGPELKREFAVDVIEELLSRLRAQFRLGGKT